MRESIQCREPPSTRHGKSGYDEYETLSYSKWLRKGHVVVFHWLRSGPFEGPATVKPPALPEDSYFLRDFFNNSRLHVCSMVGCLDWYTPRPDATHRHKFSDNYTPDVDLTILPVMSNPPLRTRTRQGYHRPALHGDARGQCIDHASSREYDTLSHRLRLCEDRLRLKGVHGSWNKCFDVILERNLSQRAASARINCILAFTCFCSPRRLLKLLEWRR